jgi:hypothetical protein
VVVYHAVGWDVDAVSQSPMVLTIKDVP